MYINDAINEIKFIGDIKAFADDMIVLAKNNFQMIRVFLLAVETFAFLNLVFEIKKCLFVKDKKRLIWNKIKNLLVGINYSV